MTTKKIIQLAKKTSIGAILFSPLIATAQPTTFVDFVDLLIGIINTAIPVLFGVVFLYLTWKVFDSWVLNAGDESKREEGKQYALTAVVVLVLMISAWGIIIMIRDSLFG